MSRKAADRKPGGLRYQPICARKVARRTGSLCLVLKARGVYSSDKDCGMRTTYSALLGLIQSKRAALADPGRWPGL